MGSNSSVKFLNRRKSLNLPIILSSFLIALMFFGTLYIMKMAMETNDGFVEDEDLYQEEPSTKIHESHLHANKIEEAKKCYQLSIDMDVIEPLEDVLNAQKKPNLKSSIFFHETSCKPDGLVALTNRQACSVETAAYLNPNRDVFVLFSAPVGFYRDKTTSPVLEALNTYDNVHLRNLNLNEYMDDTPAEEWFETEKLFSSNFLVGHMSDLLRLVTLYKYGGTYLDLDIFLLQSLDNLPKNFAAAEVVNLVNNAVINFDSEGIGHDIVAKLIRNLCENFKGFEWSANGSGVFMRVFEQICGTNIVKDMTPDKCWGFNILPSKTFYPIPWTRKKSLFSSADVVRVLDVTKDSIGVHFWNNDSKFEKFNKNESMSAYGFFASKFCPKVFHASGEYF